MEEGLHPSHLDRGVEERVLPRHEREEGGRVVVVVEGLDSSSLGPGGQLGLRPGLVHGRRGGRGGDGVLVHREKELPR